MAINIILILSVAPLVIISVITVRRLDIVSEQISMVSPLARVFLECLAVTAGFTWGVL